MTRVLFVADVDDELAARLRAEPAARHELECAGWGPAFTVRLAPDSAILSAAPAAMRRHLAPPRDAGAALYQEHCRYWLAVAADVAHREGQ